MVLKCHFQQHFSYIVEGHFSFNPRFIKFLFMYFCLYIIPTSREAKGSTMYSTNLT